MKLRTLTFSCVVALLSGCVAFDRTGVLVTPIGIAGVHSFAPSESSSRPDQMKRLEQIANQKADEQAARAPGG
jgi:hypothetical protein